MKKLFILMPILLVFLLAISTDVSAQSCYTGAGWTGPSSNPPSSNRSKPLYATCGGTQVIYGNPFLVQFGGADFNDILTNSAAGNNIRIQDETNNPEIQLQYGPTGNTDHWSMYVAQSTDAFNIWGGAQDRLTILQSGNIGIGNTNPVMKLEVGGDTRVDGNFYVDTNTGSNAAYLTRLGGSDQGLEVYATDRDLYTSYIEDSSEASPGTWHFINAEDGGNSYEFMTAQNDGDVVFNSGGNIGIGTASPAALLDINGAIKIRGGSPSSGYVLVSDADGDATWQNLSSVPGASPTLQDVLTNGSDASAFSGLVEIGANSGSPSSDTVMQIGDGSSGYSGGNLSNIILSIENNNSTGIQLLSPSTATGGLFFSNNTDILAGSIQYYHPSDYMTFYTNGYNERMRIDSSGNVGIGANSIESSIKLQVEDAAGPRILLSRNDSTTVTGDWLGQIMFDSQDGGISSSDAPVVLRAYASESHSSGDKGGYLTILTKATNDNGSISATERLRVTDAGNVGIGILSPSGKLHVGSNINGTSGDVEFYLEADADNNNESDNPRMIFTQDGDLTQIIMGFDQTNFGSNVFGIHRSNNGTPSYDGIAYNVGNGNVGIGTISPTEKLNVQGNIVASGTICDSVGCIGSGSGGAGTLLETLNAGADASAFTGTIDISGAKLTVSTIDPVYTINNKKYATYMAGMVGVKEETTGIWEVDLDELGEGSLEIDFANLPVGSDTWLFGKTTNISKHFSDLAVILTAGFNGQTWYEKDFVNKKLIIYVDSFRNSEKTVEVSYRLTAPRFDSDKWGNTTNDPTEGFNLDKLLP